MIDAMAGRATVPASPSPVPGATVGGGAMTAGPAAQPRRPTKLMAELSKAMQAAAEHARDDTLSRVDSDAKTVVEEIDAASTVDAANLRRRADDDVAAVREWSKAEMARIRELTEERIVQRKTALDGEMEAHASVVQARIERVATRVAGYRSEMDAFFGRLLAEEDPTRIATMAEMMPEPPSLAEVAAAIPEPEPAPFAPMPASSASAPPASSVESAAVAEGAAGAHAGEPATIDFAAAEAEAAALSADLVPDEEVLPAPAVAATTGRGSAVKQPAGGPATTRIVVLGLVSVASIARFKRELRRLPGVAAINVASGPDGEFVFTATHDDGLDLGAAIATLAGFEIDITRRTAEAIEVAARDPEAAD